MFLQHLLSPQPPLHIVVRLQFITRILFEDLFIEMVEPVVVDGVVLIMFGLSVVVVGLVEVAVVDQVVVEGEIMSMVQMGIQMIQTKTVLLKTNLIVLMVQPVSIQMLQILISPVKIVHKTIVLCLVVVDIVSAEVRVEVDMV